MTVDLHLHTHHSDGSWSPAELVAAAIELRLSHIAITDHDTVAGIEEAKAAAGGRLEVIPGLEINTVWTGDGGEQDVHILGYFVDPRCSRLQALLEKQQQARLDLVGQTVSRLQEEGIAITLDCVRQHAGRGSIGRPHITQAIVAAGGAADVSEAYERFMVRGSPYYVRRRSVSPQEAIAAIRAAGGVASLAHPGAGEAVQKIILRLRDDGLGAVEAYHRRHSLATVRSYIRFANRNGLAVTGGSDCHGPFGGERASVGSIAVPLDVVSGLRALLGR